jgi:two-component system NarL family response regulator
VTADRPIRVMIFDDHQMVREGIVALLQMQGDFQVVGEAGEGESAVALYRLQRPDVALVDLRMPGKDGVAVIEAIRGEFPEARLLVLTTYDSDDDVARALRAGASGYLLKGAGRQALVRRSAPCTPAVATSLRRWPTASCNGPTTSR